ncbi:hypothetical protein Tco_0732144 [Tanacetum coccineum]
MSNGSASASNRREKAKTAQPWSTTEEITLRTTSCNAMDNYGTRDAMKRGFWSEVFANFEKEIGGLFEDTIPSSSNGNIRFVLKLMRLASLPEFETQYGHPFTMEACWRILKNHIACTENEMPSFNQRHNNDV